MYIFLDESGQFTKHNGEDYFIAASFTTGNPRRTEKQFRSWHQTRFPRFLRARPEIKWSNKGIDDALRLRTLKFISQLDVRIFYTYLHKQNIPEEYRHRNRIKSGLLYTNIIGTTLELYLPITDLDLKVVCDQRSLTNMTRVQFRQVLEARFLSQMPAKAKFSIAMVDSTTSANIQIADWIAGAIAWHLEKKPLGDECYKLLQNNVVQSQELFEAYWEQKYSAPN